MEGAQPHAVPKAEARRFASPLRAFGRLVPDIPSRAEAKNYLSLGLVDEVDESDDVPFSGMKPEARRGFALSAASQDVALVQNLAEGS